MKTPKNTKSANAARAELTAKNKQTKLAQAGVKTRLRGHAKAANQRSQGKRDSKG